MAADIALFVSKRLAAVAAAVLCLATVQLVVKASSSSPPTASVEVRAPINR